jgi:hypothetical protein
MAHTYDPSSTWEAEIGMRVGGQSSLHSETLSQKTQDKNKNSLPLKRVSDQLYGF